MSYMNISRYVNIDKFVNIQLYFFTSPSGIQLIISDSPNVEITSPGLVDFLTPEHLVKTGSFDFSFGYLP